jgi:hypothetical protein
MAPFPTSWCSTTNMPTGPIKIGSPLYRVRVGEPEPELLVEDERMFGALTVDDQYLYWTSGDPEQRLNRMCR